MAPRQQAANTTDPVGPFAPADHPDAGRQGEECAPVAEIEQREAELKVHQALTALEAPALAPQDRLVAIQEAIRHLEEAATHARAGVEHDDRHAEADTTGPHAPPDAAELDAIDALAAWLEPMDLEPTEQVEPVEPVESVEDPGAPAAADPSPADSREEATTPASTTKHSYRVRRGSGAITRIATLAAFACAVVMGRQAYRGLILEQLDVSVALTVVAAVLLMVAARTSNSPRSVHLDEHGLLEIAFGDTRYAFDLSDPAPELEQVGVPGERGWRIRILRRSMSPVTIDRSLVDPTAFSEAVRQWRPEL